MPGNEKHGTKTIFYVRFGSELHHVPNQTRRSREGSKRTRFRGQANSWVKTAIGTVTILKTSGGRREANHSSNGEEVENSNGLASSEY